ncbi:TonB-dependent receptor [Pseudoalteromonas luteoviolacea]|uniref:TonB-dependent receptor n=1 Tax=Pseudoalteromonas luteoviolacea TaxID=43657 RepID=UPI001B39E476|nr:TonB-dependent receptor [Pseudoalteromonas luteoviolacea]MBQ4880329.1 TonB-dependent receptor [Pseudoalteromonas luteoviolacea]MBQ4909387.1 TonB-dependent receptor [Pseudoalteromonas luteoviolacea]
MKAYCSTMVLLGFCANTFSITAAASDTKTTHQQQFAATHYDNDNLQALHGQNALEKVNQLPGFTLVQSNQQRGLSAAGGNVLINGANTVSKSESLSDILRQLPSDQIAAIHLYSAGHPFSTASQFNQLVNIITHSPKLGAHWQVRSKLTSAYHAYHPSELAAQIALPSEGWQHQLNVHYQDDRSQSTSQFQEIDAFGSMIEQGHEAFFEKRNGRLLSLTSQPDLVDSRLVFSTKAVLDDFQTEQNRDNSSPFLWRLDESESRSEYEMAVDWQKESHHKNQWQIIALHNRKLEHIHSATFDHAAIATPYQQHKTQQEQVVQLNITLPNTAYSPEFGIEISRNQLDAATNNDGDFEQAQVSEVRYQPYAAISSEINQQWQLYTRLNTERTVLKSRAKQNHKAQLGFIKPLIRLSYDPQSNWDMTITAQHQVDQLDFDDFVQSQDAEFNRAQSGNLSLKPSQFTELATQLNVQLFDSLFFNLNLYHQWQKDIHEFIQLAYGDTMIGNAGAAQKLGGALSVTWDTTKWLAGSQFNLSYDFASARFDDPLTGSRPTDGLTPHDASVEFRQDGSTYNWGLELYLPLTETNYYVDEIYIEKDQIEFSAFAEYQLSKRLRVRGAIATLNTAKYSYVQQYFNDNRLGKYTGTRRIDERVDPAVTLSLLGQL